MGWQANANSGWREEKREVWAQQVSVFDVSELGSVWIRGASAVRRTPLAGHGRSDDYNRVGYNQSTRTGRRASRFAGFSTP
ncbi:hypothetical protein BFJ70_g16957 [Fusarium oxysporum]|jgi:glycine cleavage system aminomethyltransferase T|uniref:Uncharacterized protein n=1 Tax=Fusarium oxysporum TaxID=5507 RepID=A0A420PCJ7_FUSOX|nr:hypothetical protein BFJ71_g17421 [Fusarium oxysporum]RKK90239.1 hypothetical protein BFJ68_g16511 [Fusarium oxysporum]RKL06862.1 hypothetical protein BFJ70_g16957 [Fusarium oxysporum]